MTVFTQKLIIGSYFTAWNDLPAGDETLMITDVEGWDEMPEIRRVVKPKLFGDGSFVSPIVNFSEKLISFSMQIKYPDTTSVRAVRTNIRLIAQNAATAQTLTMVYYEDGVEVLKEVLSGYPATTLLESWEPVDNNIEFTLNFIIPNPWKTIYLDGSSTAEPSGRL